MPYPRIENIKTVFTRLDLFRIYYGIFGLLLPAATFLAEFVAIQQHPHWVISLSACAAGALGVWAVCFGGWDKRLRGVYSILTTLAVLAELVSGIVSLIDGATAGTFAVQFGAAGLLAALYAALVGISISNYGS